MKQTISIIIFIIVAIAVIWGGVWYVNHMQAGNEQAASTQAAALQAAAQAQAAQEQALVNSLNITDSVVGTGTVALTGDTVGVLYTGSLDNGKVFDASSLHGNQPFIFTIGEQNIVEGWNLGVPGMKIGGTRELTIPPSLAYGAQGYGPVPPNATLHFKIQLLSVSTSTPTTTSE